MKKGRWGLYARNANKSVLRMLYGKKATTYKLCRWEDNPEIYLEETAYEHVDLS
jgi:hypothetical protein